MPFPSTEVFLGAQGSGRRLHVTCHLSAGPVTLSSSARMALSSASQALSRCKTPEFFLPPFFPFRAEGGKCVRSFLSLLTRVTGGFIQRASPGEKCLRTELSFSIRVGGDLQGAPHLHARWVESCIRGFIQMLVTGPHRVQRWKCVFLICPLGIAGVRDAHKFCELRRVQF